MRIPTVALIAVLLSGAAQAATDVTFANPDKYIDGTFERSRSERNQREVQEGLRKMFAQMAEKYLAPGQSLSVDVQEVDLAGHLEPCFSACSDIRVMRSVTWPRLKFAYTVTENGAVVTSGEANLSDLDYLNGHNRYFDSDRLRYERQMVADWFRKTLARKAT